MSKRAVTWISIAAFAVAVPVIAVLPSRISDFRVLQLAEVGIYLIALVGLNILTGYTGQISLGHGAFMAIGGYTTAILMVDHGVKDVYTIPLAGLVAGAVGLAFGIPALRLSGLYLALATFAVAVSLPSLIKRFEGFTGGGQGISLFGIPEHTGDGPDGVSVLGRQLTFNEWMYYVTWVIALLGIALAWLLLRGRFGRAFRSVRDSETAAVSSGVSLARYKTLAFGISAMYAGVAGALFAMSKAFVNPDSFPVRLSIELVVGIVIGGLGALSGLVVGAVFIEFLPLWTQGEGWAANLPAAIIEETKKPGAPAVIYGAVLILLMFVLPSGVSGLIRRVGRFLSRG